MSGGFAGGRKRDMGVGSVLKLIGVIFAAVGFALLLVGAATLAANLKARAAREQTDAVITDIRNNTACVRFTAGDTEYEADLGEYSSGMYVGKTVSIYYDPENPAKVSTCSMLIPAVFMGIGGLFFAVGLAFCVSVAVSAGRRRSLMENGEAILAVVAEVIVNTRVMINGIHPYKAICETTDAFSGEKRRYSSDNVTTDISELVGSQVTVFVDRNNKDNYHVDVEELVGKYYSDHDTYGGR